MGRSQIYDWDMLLKEYLRSEIKSKTQFAAFKGINQSYFRRHTTDWPSKKKLQKGTYIKVVKPKSKKGNIKAKEKELEFALENSQKLPERELLFCLFYARDPVAGTAAKKAGYSPQSSYQIGWQLLQKPRIRKEIDRLKKIKLESAIFGPEDLIEKHMRIAFSNITDVLEFGRVEVAVMGPFGPVKVKDPKTGEEVVLTKIINDARFKESSEVDGGIISEVKVGRDGASIKLYDAQKSMDWLDKYFELNPQDRHKKDYDRKKLELQEKELNFRIESEKKKNW